MSQDEELKFNMRQSNVLLQGLRSDRSMLLEIISNWSMAEGRYVIRDINNSDCLDYLESDRYHALLTSLISNNRKLSVLSTPSDTLDRVTKRCNSLPVDSNTPLDRSVRRSQLFTTHFGWKIKDSMISFEGNFEEFFPSYCFDIISWLGIKTLSPFGRKEIRKLSRYLTKRNSTQGINNLILLLKVMSITVLQYLAGQPLRNTQQLGFRVKLSHGLPSCLPLIFRRWIRTGNDGYVRVIVTLLHSYKGLRGTHKVPDLSTIKAQLPQYHGILDENDPRGDQIDWNPFSFLEVKARLFWEDFNPRGVKPNLYPTSDDIRFNTAAGPNGRISSLSFILDLFALYNSELKSTYFQYMEGAKLLADKLNIPITDQSLKGWMDNMYDEFIELLQQRDPIVLHYLQIAGLANDSEFNSNRNFWKNFKYEFDNLSTEMYESVVNQLAGTKLGKLAIKLEAAGKVRVFAISDYFTQLLFRPLHRCLFEILKHHPSDATFNQEGKVREFSQRGYSFCASFDLKSATDLIPVTLYVQVLQHWMGKEMAELWRDLLNKRDYVYTVYDPKTKTRSSESFRYGRGQPMGTLSSWAGLAVVHHFLVYAAAQLCNIREFRDYLVLGDDIVIADMDVAVQYVRLCQYYGITIGLAKSFVSTIGMFQFASQNFVGDVNISPLSLKEALAASAHSAFNNVNFNIMKRVEWTERIFRRGFLSSETSLAQILKTCLSHREAHYLNQCLTKGTLPPNRWGLLVSLLSRGALLQDGRFTLSDFVLSLQKDNRVFSGNCKVDNVQVNLFLTNFVLYIESKIYNWRKHVDSMFSRNYFSESLPHIPVMYAGSFLDQMERNLLISTVDALEESLDKADALLGDILSVRELVWWDVFLDRNDPSLTRTIDFAQFLQLLSLFEKIEGLVGQDIALGKIVSKYETGIPFSTLLHFRLLRERYNLTQRESGGGGSGSNLDFSGF